MDGAECFSGCYRAARQRFRAAAAARGAAVDTYPVGDETADLTIDAAAVGPELPRRLLLVTSGLHGIEGFFGSAIQTAVLETAMADWWPPAGAALVFLHALCPFGFDQLRRTNEGNIDLNRNFLTPGETYAGSPPGYSALDKLLNPPRPPKRGDLFLPRVCLQALLQGKRRIMQTIACGQYEYPKGLFFGGSGEAATRRILADQLPRWTNSAERIVHIDFHTGLGPWASYKMLTSRSDNDAGTQILREWFGSAVEAADTGLTAYKNRGGIDEWLEHRFSDRECYSVCAEFGTYGPLSVLSALRSENQAHHWGLSDDRSKRRLQEVFAPASRDWRRTVVRVGIEVVRQATMACFAK